MACLLFRFSPETQPCLDEWHSATASLFCRTTHGTVPRPHFFFRQPLARCHALSEFSGSLWHGAMRSLFFRTTFGTVPRPHFFVRMPLARCHALSEFSGSLWPVATRSLFFRTAHGTVPRPGAVVTQQATLSHLLNRNWLYPGQRAIKKTRVSVK